MSDTRYIEEAESVSIVGYSLPKADVAIRALLLPIRRKLVNVEIINPFTQDDETKRRWEEFLGKIPRYVALTAAEHYR